MPQIYSRINSRYLLCTTLWILIGCSPNAFGTTAGNESQYSCQGRDMPLVEPNSLRFSPDCSCIASVQTGMSWEGLKIGEATLQDVQATLGEQGSLDSEDNSWHFNEQNIDTHKWDEAEACFVNGTLSLLYIGLNRDPALMQLDQLITQYSSPDRVTWGPDYSTRALFWPERGLLIFVRVSGLVNGPIVLFSPIPVEYLDTSWMIASLPNRPIGRPPEDVQLGDWKKRDPWGIER